MQTAFHSSIPLLPWSKPRKTVCPPCFRVHASIGSEIEEALSIKFENQNIKRVLDAFKAVRDGTAYERGKGTHLHQRAHSFIDGLSAKPFHENEQHPWALRLEENWEKIALELRSVTANKELLRKGTNVWAKPVVEEANSYGPHWRTLVLQDREWDAVNCGIFPVTSSLLQDEELGVPSVEAFFARQAPSTGIKLHTDDCNFVLTMHLGLDVPQDQSWIEVGGERRYWENGKSMVFDTSFFHQTMNESKDCDRTVLLIRFWHPELTFAERNALQYLFKAIEDPPSIVPVLTARSQERESRRQKAVLDMLDVPQDRGSRRERRKSSGGKNTGLKPSPSKGGGGFGR